MADVGFMATSVWNQSHFDVMNSNSIWKLAIKRHFSHNQTIGAKTVFLRDTCHGFHSVHDIF